MADAPGSPADSGEEKSPRSNSNIREQDRFLPIANISRIMKKAIPANGKIAKDAKDTVQECVSEFISFVTSELDEPIQASHTRLELKLNRFDNWAKPSIYGWSRHLRPLLMGPASDKCLKEKRKTINGDDLLWAMATLGFEDYIDPLKGYLSRYRELEGDTKGSGKKDTVGSQVVPNAQYTHQGSYTQGMSYLNSHV